MSFLLNLLYNNTTLLGLSCGNLSSSARFVCGQIFHECCHLLCIRIHLSTLKMFDYFLFSSLVYLGSTCKVFFRLILWSPATAFSTPVFSMSFCITFQFWSSYLFDGHSLPSSMFSLLHLLQSLSLSTSVFFPGFQKGRVPSEKGTFSAVNGPSKGHN